MKLTQEAADAINAARQEGRVTEGKAVRLPDDAPMTEKEFQTRILLFARAHGWIVFHDFDSRKSTPGFPDLVLARKGHVIFAELKSAKGELTLAQQRWLDELTPREDEWPGVFAWRPGDMAEIERMLT